MVEPISLAIGTAISILAKSAPHWLPVLRDTALKKGEELTIEQGKHQWNKYRDNEEHIQHMEIALKNASQQGLIRFQSLNERDQYRNVLTILSEPGSHSDTLRREALHLFTLSNTPDVTELNEIYNRSLRTRSLSKSIPPDEVNAAPYLKSFFEALITQLYADPLFKEQLSDVIKVRAAQITQQLLPEVVTTLHDIRGTIAPNYTEEQFTQDIQSYTAFIERSFHRLKMAGIVLKDRNPDPELSGIFVPIRLTLQDQTIPEKKRQGSPKDLLERYPYLVLLGGPGSGKSTVTRYLAWSHAVASQSNVSASNISLLSGNPLPLRIELRRLTEDRRQHLDYNFLSYTREVLLGREGVEINPQMFKKLLEQRKMLLLFDGLDEVATLEERRRLIEDIEHFAEHYPGNRILVTSRPVGYELARFSTPQFSHAEVQEFNDAQIRQFLERWYTYVLRLSPIPHDDQQELETLFKTLQDNPRLHKLAVNPLLLTVITALHRYERLPDRRVLIYDHCANLLLETWAKLKGTNVRWKDMKMVKEDQYACIAHLGFVLHERSQEKESDSTKQDVNSSTNDIASDVSAKFMLQEIEQFLKNRKLITETIEQRAEAKRFLQLMQEEAGLIVERGKDESDENLYGFVHRTFQEYFAAADLHERFQQEVDLTIISDFLKRYLHDPHWREVILLLLGKLKPKPATNQLRQVLEGKIINHRSQYTDIIQQDLFFICDCLTEEIAVESELAEMVVSHLSEVVKTSPFISQRNRALDYLGSFTQTRQYANLGQRELTSLVNSSSALDFSTKLALADTLYFSNSRNPPYPVDSTEQKQSIQILVNLAQSSDLSIEQQALVALTLNRCSPYFEKEIWQKTIELLSNLARRSDLSIEQQVQVAQALCVCSHYLSKEQRQATELLFRLARRSDLSIEQQVQITQTLYQYSVSLSEEQQQAIELSSQLVQRSDLSIEQQVQVAQAFYEYGIPLSEEQNQQATEILSRLAGRSDLSIEQQVQVAQALYQHSIPSSTEEGEATEILSRLAGRSDLSIEQQVQVTQALFHSNPSISEKQQQAAQLLLWLASLPYLSIQQQVQIAQALSECGLPSSERQQAYQILLRLAQLSKLSFRQHELIAQSLVDSMLSTKDRRQISQELELSIQNSEMSVEQLMEIIEDPYWSRFSSSKEQRQTAQVLLRLAGRSDLSIEQQVQVAQALYKWGYLATIEAKHQAIELLSHLVQRSDLSIEQQVQVTQAICQCNSLEEKEIRQQGIHLLSPPTQRSNLSIEQQLKEVRQQGVQLLSRLAQRSDLSIEQQLQVTQVLYRSSSPGTEEERLAAQKLLTVARSENFTLNYQSLAIEILLASEKEDYSDKIQAVQMALSLLEEGAIRQFLEEHWHTTGNKKAKSSDIKLLLELARNNILPTKIRDEMYELLQQLVPQFRNISVNKLENQF